MDFNIRIMKTNIDNLPEIEKYYDILSDGRLYSKRLGRFMKPSRSYSGSMSYMITIDSGTMGVTVARLVALKYVPKPPDKKYVGYRDGNRYNNNADNLVWDTNEEKFHRGYNKKYDRDYNVMPPELSSMLSNDARIRPVVVEGKSFGSVKEACASLNISRRTFNRRFKFNG